MTAKPKAHAAIRLRVLVHNPLVDVAVAMQTGRDGLQPPKPATKTKLTFETEAKIARAPDGAVRLTGPAMQGPANGRFLYVNWGKRAGDKNTHWDRRAKVMLGTITWKLIETAQAKGAALETEVDGIGKDGGPCCATVPLRSGWRVV